MRVLVIEDDGELAEAIGVGLRQEQMAVDVTYDGTSGLERALFTDYDVIVAGYFEGSADFGSGTFSAISGSDSDIFVTRLHAGPSAMSGGEYPRCSTSGLLRGVRLVEYSARASRRSPKSSARTHAETSRPAPSDVRRRRCVR